MRAIDEAVKRVKTQARLAELCGVRPQAVQRWVRTGSVPPRRVKQVSAVTGVSRTSLRPDLYPPRKPRQPLGALAPPATS